MDAADMQGLVCPSPNWSSSLQSPSFGPQSPRESHSVDRVARGANRRDATNPRCVRTRARVKTYAEPQFAGDVGDVGDDVDDVEKSTVQT